MSKDEVLHTIDILIEYNETTDKQGICWTCFEDPYCYHTHKVSVLRELRDMITEEGTTPSSVA